MMGKMLRRVLMTAVLSVGALGSMSFAQPVGYYYAHPAGYYYYGPRVERYREWQAREAWRRHEWYEHHVWRDGRWCWR